MTTIRHLNSSHFLHNGVNVMKVQWAELPFTICEWRRHVSAMENSQTLFSSSTAHSKLLFERKLILISRSCYSRTWLAIVVVLWVCLHASSMWCVSRALRRSQLNEKIEKINDNLVVAGNWVRRARSRVIWFFREIFLLFFCLCALKKLGILHGIIMSAHGRTWDEVESHSQFPQWCAFSLQILNLR